MGKKENEMIPKEEDKNIEKIFDKLKHRPIVCCKCGHKWCLWEEEFYIKKVEQIMQKFQELIDDRDFYKGGTEGGMIRVKILEQERQKTIEMIDKRIGELNYDKAYYDTTVDYTKIDIAVEIIKELQDLKKRIEKG